MKRVFCICIAVVLIAAAVRSFSAYTPQNGRNYQSADDSGAYVVSFSGTHADITRYTSVSDSASLNLSYAVSAVCACRGLIVLFCNDSSNNQLIVYVYDLDADTLDSFAIYGMKLYGSTDFCCDGDTIYIENHRDSHELTAYSCGGALIGRYRLDGEITALCGGYRAGVYAVGDDTLYTLSGDSFSAVSGTAVSTPLFSADSDVLASVYGDVYVKDGGRISRTFRVDSDNRANAACVIGNCLYYPCGTMVSGYDLSTGEKPCYHRLSFSPTLLYADDGDVIAVGGSSFVSIDTDDFIRLDRSDDDSSNQDNDNAGESSRGGGSAPAPSSGITSDVYRVDFSRMYITGIAPQTTVASFKNNMDYDGYSAAVYDGDTLKKSGNIGTAMTAAFTSQSESLTFELSVTGDLTGEGSRSSRDINLMLDYLIGAADFSGVYTVSADLSDDGAVNAADAALLKSMIG